EEEAQPSPHRPRPTPLRRAVRDAPRRRVLHGSEHPWGAHHDRRLTPHTHPRAGSKTHPASRSLTILPRHHDPQQEPSLLLTKNIGTPPPGGGPPHHTGMVEGGDLAGAVTDHEQLFAPVPDGRQRALDRPLDLRFPRDAGLLPQVRDREQAVPGVVLGPHSYMHAL